MPSTHEAARSGLKRTKPYRRSNRRNWRLPSTRRRKAPDDLKAHDVIAFTGLLPGREWRFVDDGRGAAVTLAPRLEVNDATAAIGGALRGGGITIALSYMVAQAIADARLSVVLDRYTPPAVPVQLVYPQGRAMAAKVRAFLDFATPRLRAALAAEARSPA